MMVAVVDLELGKLRCENGDHDLDADLVQAVVNAPPGTILTTKCPDTGDDMQVVLKR